MFDNFAVPRFNAVTLDDTYGHCVSHASSMYSLLSKRFR